MRGGHGVTVPFHRVSCACSNGCYFHFKSYSIISFLNFLEESNKAFSKQTKARANSLNDVLDSTHYELKPVLKIQWLHGQMDVHLTSFSLFREVGPQDDVQEAGPRDGVQEAGPRDSVQEAVLLSGSPGRFLNFFSTFCHVGCVRIVGRATDTFWQLKALQCHFVIVVWAVQGGLLRGETCIVIPELKDREYGHQHNTGYGGRQ